MILRAVFVLCACTLLASATAHADQKQEAKKHFDNGLKLLKAENFEAAAVEFETAVKLYPTKGGMFNLANCYKTLQRYEEALGTLALLRGEFGAELDDEYKATIDALETEIEGLVAHLTIEASEEGATLLFNGDQVGKSPLPKPLMVGPGVHDVEARLSGYEPARRTVKLASGDEKTVTLELVKSREPVIVQAGPADDGGITPLFWVGLGGTVAAGVLAGVFWGLREQSLDDYKKWGDQYYEEGETDETLLDRANDALDDSKKFKNVAIGTTITAGVLAAATLTILIIDLASDDDGEDEEPDDVGVVPTPGGVALTF
jgi:tetratricopeptide (TPR) repeat protein